MIIQAIGLLDDLDKEHITYAVRVWEWYGWHFPELAKIVQDNIVYAKAVTLLGDLVNAVDLDSPRFLGLLRRKAVWLTCMLVIPIPSEEIEVELKEAAVISVGTEVSDLVYLISKSFVIKFCLFQSTEHNSDYLKNRMNTIAPNLTALWSSPYCTRPNNPGVLFRFLVQKTLKTKHATPKYGLMYHAFFDWSSSPKTKGKNLTVSCGRDCFSHQI